MSENKRFKITKSKVVQNAHVIEDGKKQFTFPTFVGDNRGLIGYEKTLNELSEENEQLKQSFDKSLLSHTKTCDEYRILSKKNKRLTEENEQLKSVNMEMEDCLGRLEESNINLRIKLKKIRDYAKEDGEVKQGIIEKVILNDYDRGQFC